MKIAIASDHGGFAKKNLIAEQVRNLGHQVLDLGCELDESVDYPDYAQKAARAILARRAERGILICGTGIGMSIAANRFKGIRAAVCWNPQVAALAAEHNDANILCVSGRFFSDNLIKKIVKAWLTTPFGAGRHLRRIRKIERFRDSPSGKFR